MLVGSLCLSHSPLKHYVNPAADIEAGFDAAVMEAAAMVAEREPDLTIIFYPDHVNGFFYRLLPPFCIGIEATSIGDYGTAAGRLDIPADRAADLARHVLRSGVDAAISHDMQVDHGAMQPLEWLLPCTSIRKVIPIFVNCAAPPLPTFSRVRALGHAVGDWARGVSERVVIIGSGGLSHDPPMPALETASPEVRNRIVEGANMSHLQRFSRQNGASSAGRSMAAGKSNILPASVEWDRVVLDAFAKGDLHVLDNMPDAEISSKGGRGGHEVRTWIAALAALNEGFVTREFYHKVIDEWITGMAILVANDA